MLYIFDMGNVIINIDFNRALQVWSELSKIPINSLAQKFELDETVKLHECDKISDFEFAEFTSEKLGLSLSFEEFALGWNAIFVSLRYDVIEIMARLREQGHRVLILSNTNRLHQNYWPSHYPEIAASSYFLYLSQDLGMRKPDLEIYKYVLQSEGFAAEKAIFLMIAKKMLLQPHSWVLKAGMLLIKIVSQNILLTMISASPLKISYRYCINNT